MGRSNPTEFTLAAMKGGKRPPETKEKPEAKAKKVSKKARKTRALLGDGLAGRAVDALKAYRVRRDKMADQ